LKEGKNLTATIKLYDLAGAEEERRFSPFCWRTKMALAHKGLDVETIPWRYADKPKLIELANWERVPVIVDGDKPVADSWGIANYLEIAYPDRPSLFGGEAGIAAARFVNSWADTALNAAIARVVMADVLNHLAEGDRAYFRESREQRLGMTLEAYAADREAHLAAVRQALEPVRLTLATQPFLGGEAPRYSDYIVFGSIQWARSICPERLIEVSDPIEDWRTGLLDAFDGLARNAPGYW
jgi:glutathione S-transferase